MHLDPDGLAGEVRRAHCRSCRTPCGADPGDPAAFCPLPVPLWGRPTGIGLGDAVAFVAQPIARVSDALLRTKLTGCASCAERHARWNRVRLGG